MGLRVVDCSSWLLRCAWLLPCVAVVACYEGLDDPISDGGTGSTASATNTDGPSTTDMSSASGDGDGTTTNSGDGDGDGTTTNTTNTGDGDGDPTTGDGDGDPTTGDGDGEPTTGDGDGEPPSDDTCERWNADRQDLSEGDWTGQLNGCSAGDMAGDWRQRSLKLINLYRWLADLDPVTTDPGRDQQAQACALMMHANGALSHSPPMNWSCYSAPGATAAGSSNIAGAPGVQAVDLYMADPGNATTLGHRRWILSNSFGPTGIGSTDTYSCLWAFGSDSGGPSWLAWPTPGEFPIQAMNASWASVDETGWSIQVYAPFSLTGAQVTITADGQPRPVNVTALLPNYGSSQAISIIPQGWTSQANTTYHVEVSGVPEPFEYDVTMVDCG